MGKTLDLNLTGVMELGSEELKVVEGGWIRFDIIVNKTITAIDDFMDGVWAGFDDNNYKPE